VIAALLLLLVLLLVVVLVLLLLLLLLSPCSDEQQIGHMSCFSHLVARQSHMQMKCS
jgi:hypothetical protein